MRDKLRDKSYFNKQVTVLKESIQEIGEMIRTGKTAPERVNFMKQLAIGDLLNIINSLYSGGNHISEINPYLITGINLVHESWDGFWLIEHEGKKISQYGLSGYDEMLWMLSLGYLLNISNEDFKKLVDVIDRDGVKDLLFEFIIVAKIKDRKRIKEESYQEYFGVPQILEKLRQAIGETVKSRAEKLVKEFISKDWYKNHKDSSWYNSHKSKHDTYFGYWSYETAAVVKIMGLDDSSFLDCQYYPGDFVHQKTA